MKIFAQKVQRFLESEDGPTAVEYAVMVALVAIAIITAVTAMGTALSDKFGEVETAITTDITVP